LKNIFETTNREKNGMENGWITTTMILYRVQGIICQKIPTAKRLPDNAILDRITVNF
jgi:hypothetical protein